MPRKTAFHKTLPLPQTLTFFLPLLLWYSLGLGLGWRVALMSTVTYSQHFDIPPTIAKWSFSDKSWQNNTNLSTNIAFWVFVFFFNVHTECVGASGSQKRLSPPGTGVLGRELWSSERAGTPFNHWDISPVSQQFRGQFDLNMSS